MKLLRTKSGFFAQHRGRKGHGVASRHLRGRRRTLGQATLEYALLLGIAAALSVGFTAFFKGMMEKGIQTFNAVLEKELCTGNSDGEYREACSSWEN